MSNNEARIAALVALNEQKDARISQLEAQLREREAQLHEMIASRDGFERASFEQRARAESAEAALAEARAENERLRVEMEQHMQVAASRCSRLLDTEAALAALTDRANDNAILASQAIDAKSKAEAALASAREELQRERLNRRELRWTDMTPDSGMVTRILSAYIDETTCTDNLAGLDPESLICKMMNENTAQRNVLIKSALAALRRADDAGRVERAADEMFRRSRLVDNRSFDEDRDYWMGVARAVLAAADREGE